MEERGREREEGRCEGESDGVCEAMRVCVRERVMMTREKERERERESEGEIIRERERGKGE